MCSAGCKPSALRQATGSPQPLLHSLSAWGHGLSRPAARESRGLAANVPAGAGPDDTVRVRATSARGAQGERERERESERERERTCMRARLLTMGGHQLETHQPQHGRSIQMSVCPSGQGGGLKIHCRQLRVGSNPTADTCARPAASLQLSGKPLAVLNLSCAACLRGGMV